jgi:hypothetical protein
MVAVASTPPQEAPDPLDHLALTQPADRQGEQHLFQGVALIFLQQPNLFPAPQTRHPHLLQGSPQRLPALAHRVDPAIHLLALLPELGDAAIPLPCEQPFDGLLQLLQETLPNLRKPLLDHLLQC